MATAPAPEYAWPTGAPAWVAQAQNPYLEGHYAPVTREFDGHDCVVEGELPADLQGVYLRNGPNNAFPPLHRHHWFDGDAMVHGLVFEGGKARYVNQWVRTPAFEAERQAGRAIWPGVMGPYDFSLPLGPIKDTANTDIIGWRGEALALWYYTGQPLRVDPRSLKTNGIGDFDGTLPWPIAAHAHVDEASGEMLIFSVDDLNPVIRYGVVAPSGKVVHNVEVALPGPRAPHDIGFTTNWTILHDLPFFHDAEILRRHGRRVVSFHRDMPSRFGFIPRFGLADEVRWFDAEPGYILHVVNCWEDGEWVTMDGYRSQDPSIKPKKEEGELASLLAYLRLVASLYRWRFNLRTGEVREGPLDDLNAEFCRINTAIGGTKGRFHYVQHIPTSAPTLLFHSLVKYDTETGARQIYDYGAGVCGSESPFAPRTGVDTTKPGHEDDGYVLTFATDAGDWSSQCLIFDAKDISTGPIARVKLPQRLPMGFHASWIPASGLVLP